MVIHCNISNSLYLCVNIFIKEANIFFPNKDVMWYAFGIDLIKMSNAVEDLML